MGSAGVAKGVGGDSFLYPCLPGIFFNHSLDDEFVHPFALSADKQGAFFFVSFAKMRSNLLDVFF